MGSSQRILPDGYEIREMGEEEFRPLWEKYAPPLFDDNSQIFRVFQFLSEDEKQKARHLQSLMGHPFQLRLGVFHNNEFVGWSAGEQESSETFYMRNSAILPEHRRNGLYTALLRRTLELVTQAGFQKIYSRHNATNNAIIIPKLKLGFTIGALEVSDKFGVLVHLNYFQKELRRKMTVYRAGDLKPDDEIKRCLNLA